MNSAPKLDKPIDEGGFFNKVWLIWFDRLRATVENGFAGAFQPANVLGTTNQIDRSDNGTNVTLSLSSTIKAPGSVEIDGKDIMKMLAAEL